MRRITVAVAALALAAAPAALAKGPSSATITGPGLAHPIVFRGFGEPGADTAFGRLVDGLGFFPAAFGQQPSPMLARRPAGALGPRYTVRYRVPGAVRGLVQALYPFANGGAFTYTKPGAPLFRGMRIPGGWYAVPQATKALLIRRGLPQ